MGRRIKIGGDGNGDKKNKGDKGNGVRWNSRKGLKR